MNVNLNPSVWGAKRKGEDKKSVARELTLEREIAFFFMRKRGKHSDRDVQVLRRRLERMECPIEKDALDRFIQAFSDRLDGSPCHLFCCGGKACKKKSPVKLTEKKLSKIEKKLEMGISVTPCQGICGEAFVATVKEGKAYTMLSRLHRKKNWKSLLERNNN